jgi:hypothetical protein
VVQDIVMAGMRTSVGLAFMDLAFAPGTPPSLFVPDKPPHSGDRRPFFEPVLHTAGGLTAEGMLVSRIEVYSVAAATGTGTPGDPLLFFRSILAIFTHYHNRSHFLDPVDVMTHIFLPGPDNTGAGWVKVFRAMSISGPYGWTRGGWIRQVGAPVVTLADDSPKRYLVCHGDAVGWCAGAHRKTKPALLRLLLLQYPFQDNQQIGIFLIHPPYRK